MGKGRYQVEEGMKKQFVVHHSLFNNYNDDMADMTWHERIKEMFEIACMMAAWIRNLYSTVIQ